MYVPSQVVLDPEVHVAKPKIVGHAVLLSTYIIVS